MGEITDARSRSVYLPAGEVWVDYWTKTEYTGGQTIEVSAPLEQIPAFAKKAAACYCDSLVFRVNMRETSLDWLKYMMYPE